MTRRRSAWLVPSGLFILAALVRLPWLDARPLHHDEGSNVIFLLRLLREGVYRYDPTNYHGPLYYYLTALPLLLGGLSVPMLRLVTALLGSAMAPMAWALRRPMGDRAGAAAGALLAASPSLVYYARDSIHETILVFFTLLLVIAGARAAATGKLAWAILAGAAAGCMIATKETAWLSFGALGAGWLLAGGPRAARLRPAAVLAASVAALLVAAAFYSSFFTDTSGLAGLGRAFAPWARRAFDAEGHGKPPWYFPMLLAGEEPVLALAAIAGGFAAWRRRSTFGRFLLGWAAATVVMYSVFTYKTPWLVLNMVLPLALLGGAGWEAAAGALVTWKWRRPVRLLAAGLLGLALTRAVTLSFLRYDEDGASPLIYVQTRRDVRLLASRIDGYARRHPDGRRVRIEILAHDYLPLNWYLRDYENTAYYAALIDAPCGDVVIARAEDAEDVSARLGRGYRREIYDLRPGVRLALFLKSLGSSPSPGHCQLPDAAIESSPEM